MVNINIPLPASCASCPLSVRHFGKLYCPPLNGRVGNEGKDSRCPLVDAGDHIAEVSKKGDLISRHDALSCFHDWIDQRGDVHTADEMPEYQRIEQLPSVQPERKTGKWIEIHGFCTPGGDPVWACSECGKGVHVYGIEHGTYGADVSDGQWKACPNCGCRMEGEEHETD